MGRLFGYMIFNGIRATDTGAEILDIVEMILLGLIAIGLLCTLLEPVYEKIKEWAEAKRSTREYYVEDGETYSSKLMRWVIFACCLSLIIVCMCMCYMTA